MIPHTLAISATNRISIDLTTLVDHEVEWFQKQPTSLYILISDELAQHVAI